MEQETNNFCRNPTDAVKPFCRTGGTDEAPVFRTCGNVQECPDTGCSHDLVNGSDYTGKLQQLYTSNDFNAEIIGNIFNDLQYYITSKFYELLCLPGDCDHKRYNVAPLKF